MNFAHRCELFLWLLYIHHTLETCVWRKRGQKDVVLNNVSYRLIEAALGVVKLRWLLLIVINPDCNCHVVHLDFQWSVCFVPLFLTQLLFLFLAN
jgi:hypothetical protein